MSLSGEAHPNPSILDASLGGIEMIYVIQVETGKEEETCRVINALANSWNEVFYVRQEKYIRRGGEYSIVLANMFPGYIFIDTENPDSLFLELKSITSLTILLSDKNESGYNFINLSEREEDLLRNLINGDEEYIVRISRVEFDENNRISEAEGPLANFMECLTEVDRRHRRAFVEFYMMGELKRLMLGIKQDVYES